MGSLDSYLLGDIALVQLTQTAWFSARHPALSVKAANVIKRDDPGEVAPRIAAVVGDLNQAIGDIRSYIMDLRPRELQGRKMDEALESLAGYLKDRTGVSVNLDVAMDLTALSERYMVNLWHIFQEAFSNIEKYAAARTVDVSLSIVEDTLCLEPGNTLFRALRSPCEVGYLNIDIWFECD